MKDWKGEKKTLTEKQNSVKESRAVVKLELSQ